MRTGSGRTAQLAKSGHRLGTGHLGGFRSGFKGHHHGTVFHHVVGSCIQDSGRILDAKFLIPLCMRKRNIISVLHVDMELQGKTFDHPTANQFTTNIKPRTAFGFENTMGDLFEIP